MAISPLLEQRDSKIIVKTVLNSKKTIKELNEHFMTTNILNISTATLYRRVKELYLAGFLEKLEDGSYTASDYGRTAYNELFNKNEQSSEIQNSISEVVRQLSKKDAYILQKLHKRPTFTSGILKEISISPNDLLKVLDYLLQIGLIEVVEKPRKKPGRPKKVYRLTNTGEHTIQEIEILKQKLQWKY